MIALVQKQLQATHVRFGSKADMCGAKRYVRFAPESDRESRHPQRVMSALPLKADMCGATNDVGLAPKADALAIRKGRSFALFLFQVPTQHDVKLGDVSNGRQDQSCCQTNHKWTNRRLNKYSQRHHQEEYRYQRLPADSN